MTKHVNRRSSSHGVTDELLAFLADVDTAFLASASGDGQPYVQHRGGPRGFLRGIDERTIGFVDFIGNRQYLTTGNLAENDRVCLIAIDYATRRRVKIWGRARVVPATPELVAKLRDPAYRGRVDQVMLLEVAAWDVNCPMHIPRKIDADEAERALDAVRAQLDSVRAQLDAAQARIDALEARCLQVAG